MSHDQRPWHDDEEDWSEAGDDGLGDPDAALPCPECGAVIYDELDHCPKCGYWLTDADHRSANTGRLWPISARLVAVLLLLIFFVSLLLSGSIF